MTSMRARYIFAELPAEAKALLDNAYYQDGSEATRSKSGWRIAARARGRHALEKRGLVGGGTFLTPLGEQVREVALEDMGEPRQLVATR